MLRMNREKKSINTFIKKECANYNTGHICDGIIINEKLSQWIDSDYVNKKCQVIEGKKCTYYDRCLKPLQGSY
tara:strand:- start:5045 stop:5263 length:219 start_codon:yes stop_codon:yes gene_type:complete